VSFLILKIRRAVFILSGRRAESISAAMFSFHLPSIHAEARPCRFPNNRRKTR
jgi:hypothetical protein